MNKLNKIAKKICLGWQPSLQPPEQPEIKEGYLYNDILTFNDTMNNITNQFTVYFIDQITFQFLAYQNEKYIKPEKISFNESDIDKLINNDKIYLQYQENNEIKQISMNQLSNQDKNKLKNIIVNYLNSKEFIENYFNL